MLFGTHARLSDADFGITFKGRLIKRAFEFKYLGVVFNKHISWNSHVKYVLSRAGKRLGMLGRIRGNLTSDCPFTSYGHLRLSKALSLSLIFETILAARL